MRVHIHASGDAALAGLLLLCGAGAAHADGSLKFAFTPDPLHIVGISPEGCYQEPGEARGMLAAPAAGQICHSATFGPPVSATVSDGPADVPADPSLLAEFMSAPFSRGLALAGPVTVVLHFAKETAAISPGNDVDVDRLWVELDEIRPGEEIPLAALHLMDRLRDTGATGGAGQAVSFDIGAHNLGAGSRLRLRLGTWTALDRGKALFTYRIDGSKDRLLFGGDSLYGGPDSLGGGSYADSGISFSVAGGSARAAPDADPELIPGSDLDPQTSPQPGLDDSSGSSAEAESGTGSGGGLPAALLLPLFVAGLWRRRASRSALALALLVAAAAPAAEASLFLAFTPDPSRAGGVSPEGCYTEPGLALGVLTASSDASTCHVGQLGSEETGLIAGDAPTHTVAAFSTSPLSTALPVGGRATLVVYHNVQSGVGGDPPADEFTAWLDYQLREKKPAGHYQVIVSGTAFAMPPGGGRGEVTFEVPAYTVSSGSRFEVLLLSPKAPEGRVFFGGAPLIPDPSDGNTMYYASYADAGITLDTGDHSSGGGLQGIVGGGLPPALLAPLLALGLIRRSSNTRTAALSRGCARTPSCTPPAP